VISIIDFSSSSRLKKEKTFSISGRAFLPEKLKNAFFHYNLQRGKISRKNEGVRYPKNGFQSCAD